jgi:hypothetical protein
VSVIGTITLTVVMPISPSDRSLRAHLDHGLGREQRGQHHRLDRRLAQELLGRLPRRRPLR